MLRLLPLLLALASALPAGADGPPPGGALPRPAAPPQAPPPARPGAGREPGPAQAAAGPHAVVTSPGTGLPVPETRVTWRAVAMLPTEVGEGLGEYEARRVVAEMRWSRDLSSSVQVACDLALERGSYRFEDEAALLPLGSGSLGEDYASGRLALGGSWRLSRTLGLALGASLRASLMDGAHIDEALQPGGLLAVRMRLWGSSDLLLGISATQGLEGDAYVLPIAGMGGSLGGGARRWRVEARGPGASFVYDLTPRLALGAFAGYERRDIRLAPDAREPGGVLREQRAQVGVEAILRTQAGASLHLCVGCAAWNRLSILDREGEAVLEQDTDPAPFVQLEWALRL